MKRRTQALAASASLALAGCATVGSTQIADSEWMPPSDAQSISYPPGTVPCSIDPVAGCYDALALRPSHAGLTYFLPRQLTKVTVRRVAKSLSDALDELGKAQLALSVAEAKVTAAKAAVSKTEDQLIASPDVADIRRILTERLAEQKTARDLAVAEVAQSIVKRDAARSQVIAASLPGNVSADPNQNISVNIELLAPTADPAQGYRLDPRHSVLRDDEHKVVITGKGLLTSTNVVAADRTADIAVELVAFAGQIMGITTGGMPGIPRTGAERDPEYRCPATLPEQVIEIVDFADAWSVYDANARLQCMGVRLDPAAMGTPSGASMPKEFSGIAYRTPVDVLVQIRKCTQFDPQKSDNCKLDSDWATVEIAALSLPQAGPISFIRQDAGMFTKTEYALAFKDGVLLGYDSRRPSEIMHLAAAPARLVSSLFEGVGKGLGYITGANNGLADLSASQLALLQADNELAVQQFTGQSGLNAAQLALLQSQLQLQLAGPSSQQQLSAAQLQAQLAALSGETQLNSGQLALLQAQTQLATGQNAAASQISSSQLALMTALLSNQARTDAINRCIGERITQGEPIDACLQ